MTEVNKEAERERERWKSGEDEQRTEHRLRLICKNNSAAAAWWRSKLGQRIPTESGRERQGEGEREGGVKEEEKMGRITPARLVAVRCSSRPATAAPHLPSLHPSSPPLSVRPSIFHPFVIKTTTCLTHPTPHKSTAGTHTSGLKGKIKHNYQKNIINPIFLSSLHLSIHLPLISTPLSYQYQKHPAFFWNIYFFSYLTY